MHILDQILQGDNMYKIKFKSGEEKEFETLEGADLRHAYLYKSNLSYTNFNGADLRHADLRDSDFLNSNFRNCNLEGADFFGSDLRNATLTDANLTGTILEYTKLRNADFRRANLSFANFYRAEAQHVDFRYCKLIGTRFEYTDLIDSYMQYAEIKSIQPNHCIANSKNLYTIHSPYYTIVVTPSHFHIGCESHPRRHWKEFTKERIERMDGEKALKFWYQSGVREILFELP